MQKIIIVIALFLSLLFVLRAGKTAFQEDFLSSEQPVSEEADTSAPEIAKLVFYPPVSGTRSDLDVGYLFNQARSLVDEITEEEGAEDVLESRTGGGVDVDVNDVTYIGSIITDTTTRALISYQAGRGGASRKTSGRASRAATGRNQYTQLNVGEVFSGYKVSRVTPNKIVFEKGEEVVEKFLYDPKKKRDQPKDSGLQKPTDQQRISPPGQGDSSVTVVGGGVEPAMPGGSAQRNSPVDSGVQPPSVRRPPATSARTGTRATIIPPGTRR
ncbi:MAG: hypothetical protein KKE17_03260 [Proteobacteria bacterium]|nr:hypothetical protein [Pseudomonadota bacterium]MBU1709002.1 hypothetical protein [Pseudomonadota bacterium]